MVGGDFQKSLQPFVAYGYCVFEDDVCVDPSGIPNGRPNFANITFSKLFAGLAWTGWISPWCRFVLFTCGSSELGASCRCPPTTQGLNS